MEGGERLTSGGGSRLSVVPVAVKALVSNRGTEVDNQEQRSRHRGRADRRGGLKTKPVQPCAALLGGSSTSGKSPRWPSG